MPLSNTSTCNHCGFTKDNCMCGRKRNTSGEYQAYQNYRDYRSSADYAMTARINRTSSEDKKIMEELIPVDQETLQNYIKRTDIGEQKLIEYSIQQHLYGTSRVWSCHTSSRYCFICTMAQFLNQTRSILLSLSDIIDTSKIIIDVHQNDDGIPTISLTSI